MRYQNKDQDWNRIKQALKDKYSVPTFSHNVTTEESKPDSDIYWSKMTRLTGKSKEDFQKRFTNL
jgi:hypothetical protein